MEKGVFWDLSERCPGSKITADRDLHFAKHPSPSVSTDAGNEKH
jgi:hypothetical protein